MADKAFIMWGASGHAKVITEFLPDLGYELLALFDNDPELCDKSSAVPVMHGMNAFNEWHNRNEIMSISGTVAVGGTRGRDRVELLKMMESRQIAIDTMVHPHAYLARDSVLGPGCHVLAGSVIGTHVEAGMGCIFNTLSSIDHECRLGMGVHVAPGATLAGCVEVGDYAMIGAGAVVLPRVSIARDAIIGAGAVVTSDVEEGSTVIGCPARKVSC